MTNTPRNVGIILVNVSTFRYQATPLVNNDRKLQEYFRVRIAEHQETFDANNIRDFIDMYLKLEDDQEFSDSLTGELSSGL